jgi:hypothetical protein
MEEKIIELFLILNLYLFIKTYRKFINMILKVHLSLYFKNKFVKETGKHFILR